MGWTGTGKERSPCTLAESPQIRPIRPLPRCGVSEHSAMSPSRNCCPAHIKLLPARVGQRSPWGWAGRPNPPHYLVIHTRFPPCYTSSEGLRSGPSRPFPSLPFAESESSSSPFLTVRWSTLLTPPPPGTFCSSPFPHFYSIYPASSR